jgi:lysophospholipase L1-like esterase
MRRSVLLVLFVAAAVVAACSDADSSSTTTPGGTEPSEPQQDVMSGDGKLSIVVIGDSVAAGEGIAYGYTYDYDASSPESSHWTGGTDNPTWQGPYQLCHDDAEAYGEVVAAALGAVVNKFACTGATYLNGITTDQTMGSGQVTQVMRPAQFGDWSTKANLNPDYDKAAPDVVVLTFGADDVSFVPIVKYCILGYTQDADELDKLIAEADDAATEIHRALGRARSQLDAARQQSDGPSVDESSASRCTAANPGETVETLFWEPINSGEVAQHYKDIVTAIKARGQDPSYGNGKVPEIVFTTYHHPLPAGLDGDCWDVWPLTSGQQSYLQSLQDTLQQTLEDAVKDLDGVTVADISKVMDGHQWCTEDPWAYGLSVINYELHTDSQAPFHPTPDGQAAIAAVVEESIKAITAQG